MHKALSQEEFVSLFKKAQASRKVRKDVENQAEVNLKYEKKGVPYYEKNRNGTW